MFAQYVLLPGAFSEVGFFSSVSWMDARYRDAFIRTGNENRSIDGNRVESVPEIIARSGITMKHRNGSLTLLYSHTSETYADALNTVAPNRSGTTGIVPAYGIADINAGISLHHNLQVRLNAGNILNRRYFTKRPQLYPGPGIWPSDGRTFSITISASI
jgi:Fe(3+) dicitrate transport protein